MTVIFINQSGEFSFLGLFKLFGAKGAYYYRQQPILDVE